MKEENQKHEIKTLVDVLKCTNLENIDRFLEDFRAWVVLSHTMQNFSDAISKVNGTEPETLGNDGFTWMDDGETNVTMRLQSPDVNPEDAPVVGLKKVKKDDIED